MDHFGAINQRLLSTGQRNRQTSRPGKHHRANVATGLQVSPGWTPGWSRLSCCFPLSLAPVVLRWNGIASRTAQIFARFFSVIAQGGYGIGQRHSGISNIQRGKVIVDNFLTRSECIARQRNRRPVPPVFHLSLRRPSQIIDGDLREPDAASQWQRYSRPFDSG